MRKNRAEVLIEKYLDRVRAYLPLESEEYLIEIRTHIIQEAERIGNGTVTEGSVLLAIEHMGEPKVVANEYAGTGKRVGPIPVEYIRPIAALSIVFMGIGFAVVLGMVVVAQVLLGVTAVFSSSILFEFLVVASIVVALIVVEHLELIDTRSIGAERTLFERILGIGEDALRKKSTIAAFLEYTGGLVFAVLLLLPQIRILFTESFITFIPTVFSLFLFGSIVGLLFFLYGENNVTLALEIVLSVAWVVLSVIIIHIGWPLKYIYLHTGSTLVLFDMMNFVARMGLSPNPLLIVWVLVIFITIVSCTWRIIAGTAKVSWYIRKGRGLWWNERANQTSFKSPPLSN